MKFTQDSALVPTETKIFPFFLKQKPCSSEIKFQTFPNFQATKQITHFDTNKEKLHRNDQKKRKLKPWGSGTNSENRITYRLRRNRNPIKRRKIRNCTNSESWAEEWAEKNKIKRRRIREKTGSFRDCERERERESRLGFSRERIGERSGDLRNLWIRVWLGWVARSGFCGSSYGVAVPKDFSFFS